MPPRSTASQQPLTPCDRRSRFHFVSLLLRARRMVRLGQSEPKLPYFPCFARRPHKTVVSKEVEPWFLSAEMQAAAVTEGDHSGNGR